jgi:hypothetical protein
MAQVANFQRVPSRLQAAQTALVNAKRAAETKGKIGYATEAALAIQNTMTLQAEHAKASVSVATAMDQLRTSGLLAGPVDVVAAVLDAATRVTSILKSTDSVEAKARDLTSKVMSPEEQAATGQSGTGGYVLKYLLYGGLFYLGLYAFRKSRGGTKSW